MPPSNEVINLVPSTSSESLLATTTTAPVKTVTLCQPPLPPPTLTDQNFISTKSATILPAFNVTSKSTKVTTAAKLPALAPAIPSAAAPKQKLTSIKKRKSRSKKMPSALPTAIIHLPVQPPQPPQDVDVYLNSSASNVSPDSGIQSEGVASSSPLHLGDIVGSATSTYPATAHIQQQTISLGHSAAVLTSSTTRNWAAAAAAAAPTSPVISTMQQTGAFYGQIVQQSSTTQTQFVQNQTNTAQTTYLYHNAGPAPILVGTATTTTSQKQFDLFRRRKEEQQPQQQPPTLLPAVPVAMWPLKEPSSSSSEDSSAKRGRGRPKGSKNKARKGQVTMVTSGSQTVESSLEKKRSFRQRQRRQ